MIKTGGSKTLNPPAVTIPYQESIVATIASYINKTKTKDEALNTLVAIEKKITKTG